MHTNRFWELWAKQLSGNITPEELQELEYLKGEDEFMAYSDNLIQTVSSLSFHSKESMTGEELEDRWMALQHKTGTAQDVVKYVPATPSKKALLFRYAGIAAALVLVFFIGWKWMKLQPPVKGAAANIVSTKNGSRSKIQMPDGTQIWLNAGSTLKYNNETFGKNLREIELVGEAYFDVAKDTVHPFVIHTKAVDVKVTGTAFNIRAYPNEKQTETALIRGAVEVSFPGRPAEKFHLKPNEKISVANEAPQITAHAKESAHPSAIAEPIIVLSTIEFEPSDSAVVETSWIRNKLIFRSKRFEELTQDMERWYNVNIAVKDSSLMQRQLTGTFHNETVFEALDFLKLSSPFQYSYNKETNTITLFR